MCQPCQCVGSKPQAKAKAKVGERPSRAPERIGFLAKCSLWPKLASNFSSLRLQRWLLPLELLSLDSNQFAGGNFIIMVKWKCYILWKCIIMSIIKMSLNDTCACSPNPTISHQPPTSADYFDSSHFPIAPTIDGMPLLVSPPSVQHSANFCWFKQLFVSRLWLPQRQRANAPHSTPHSIQYKIKR